MSEQSEIFGFPVAPALRLGEALEHMRIASGGRIGGDDSMLSSMMGLLPLVEQAQSGAIEVMPGIREETGDFVPRIEPYVEVLQDFKNPRRTFVTEIERVSEAVLAAAAGRKSDFGTGEVAHGITGVLGELMADPEAAAAELPMLSGIIMARKRRPKPLKFPPAFIVGTVAPEILTMLHAPLPRTRQKPDVIRSIGRSPLAIVAALTHGRELQALRRAAPHLLPSVRDLLPTKGAEVTGRFEAVREFLES